jgi:hypothetical protein
MIRRFAAAVLALSAVANVGAGSAAGQANPIRPSATSAVGSWEVVVWTAAQRVHHCTLVRAAPAAGEPKFGVLIDRRGVVLSVDTTAWLLTPKTEIPAVLIPGAGAEHRITAKPVSPTRANIELAAETPLLDQLQRSEHLDVRIGQVTVRVSTDDFNPARVVLDICVHKIGTAWRAPTG